MQFTADLVTSTYVARSATCDRLDNLQDPAVLPRLGPLVRHGTLGASWDPITAFYTGASIETTTLNGTRSYLRATASRGWLERHDKTSLDFDFDVDGYDPAWTSTASLTLSIQLWNLHSIASTTTGEAP